VLIDPWANTLTVQEAKLITINSTLPADQAVADRVQYWADIVAPILAQPVGTANVDLVRNYNGESNMGNMVADGMRWKADMYDDGVLNDSVQIAFTNAGGLRADILAPVGAALPYNITWGDTFNVLPFGNTLFLMDLTGAQIQALLDQSATLYKGMLQSSGLTFRWYNSCGCSTPTEWSAFDARVDGRLLNPAQTYRVVTNNFLATGGDSFAAFNSGSNRWDTYYDMQLGVNEYIQWYNTNVGPVDHEVEGRALFTMRNANDTYIERNLQNRNYSTAATLPVGWKKTFTAIVQFPVNLPAAVTIDSATLQLYGAGWSGVGAPIDVSAYAILRAMTVNEVTWNIAQVGNPWAIGGANDTATDRRAFPESAISTASPRRWYAFDLTALVQEWVNGSTANNGVLLEAGDKFQERTFFFAASESTGSSVRPRLVIQWH
jgi:hypothetical protein